MALSPGLRTLLKECASLIANGAEASELDLSPLGRETFDAEELVMFLALEVEAHSGFDFTVREADKALFARHAQGPTFYLARCVMGAPREVVAELDANTILFTLGPRRRGGYRFDVAHASLEQLTGRLASAQASQLTHALKQEEQARDQAAAAQMVYHLKGIATMQRNTVALRRLEKVDPSIVSLVDIASICRMMNIDLGQVILAAAL